MASARPSPSARSIRPAVALCAALALGACAPPPAPLAEEPTADPTPLAAPTVARSAPAPAAAEPEELLTAAPDEYSRVGDLVPGFPIDLLPVPADAVLLVTASVPVGESTVREVSLNLRTSGTVVEILELYRRTLTEAGFTEVPPSSAQSDLAAETTFVRSNGSELVSIGVLDVDGRRTVAIGGRVETQP